MHVMEKTMVAHKKYINIKNARKFRSDNLRKKKDAKFHFPSLIGKINFI